MRRAGRTACLMVALLTTLYTTVNAFLPIAGPVPSSALLQSRSRSVASSMPRHSAAGVTVLKSSEEKDQAEEGGAAAAAPAPAPAPVAAAPAPRERSSPFPKKTNNNAVYNKYDRNSNRTPETDRPTMNDVLVRTGPKEVRVVLSKGEDGDEMMGVMNTKDALAKARELDMDLIMISETAVPPVCKIIDYGKFKYSMEKKKKEQKKKAKTTEVKEVKMSYKIETHDYGVRMRQMLKFLEDGDKVKAMVQFRGREQQHIDLGVELLQKVGADLKEIASMEGEIKREGGRLMAMFKPKKI